jgi:phospholipid/cholesterol/gamma-HCH transport system substrate-binding protein
MHVLKDFRGTIIGVALIVLTVVVAYLSWPREDYSVKISMVSAQGLAVGGRVWIDGFDAGWVENIQTRDGKAIVTAGIVPAHAPLHTGTRARVQWYAALGERILTIYPGPASNPEVPNGGLMQAQSEQVEVDEVLAALDAPTRQKLDGLIASIHTLTAGKEPDIQQTLQSAGPTVKAAGAIFDAVGRDGPAIHQLVQQLQRMIEVTARQQNDIRGTVTGLDSFSGNVATQQAQLSEDLHRLPPTLREANATLREVSPAVDKANKMLEDLRPGTRLLPEIADDLGPALHDLRPTVHHLKPGLQDLRDVLYLTPRLLDFTNVALPKARDFVKGYNPAISYLRPYTPELEGFLQNWGKNFGVYDSQGHLWAAVLGEGSPQAFDESPATVPPVKQVGRPKPGAPIGQSWDANGDEEH